MIFIRRKMKEAALLDSPDSTSWFVAYAWIIAAGGSLIVSPAFGT